MKKEENYAKDKEPDNKEKHHIIPFSNILKEQENKNKNNTKRQLLGLPKRKRL